MNEPHIHIYAPERDFVLPYIRQALPNAIHVDTPADADVCIMLSSTDIYAADNGFLIDEKSRLDTSSVWFDREKAFAAACRSAGKRYVILRCAGIIGTGMTGSPRRLAEMIWRGTLMHIAGNEAHVSVVHATDVANAIATMVSDGIGDDAIYNLTDGENPAFDDLVDSLAYRMADKRVSSLSTRGQLWLAPLLYGKRLYRAFTTNRTYDCSAFCAAYGFTPTPVCRYLRTHNYDDTSL